VRNCAAGSRKKLAVASNGSRVKVGVRDKLKQVSITIPDDVLACSGLTEHELRQELAIALFQVDRLTLAQAARLAGKPQLEFQKVLASRRIPNHYGLEELEEDLQRVRRVQTH
jgi:predicted HTH domain antitoxin